MYRIVPWVGSTTGFGFFSVEKKGWWFWHTVYKYNYSREEAVRLIKHLESK